MAKRRTKIGKALCGVNLHAKVGDEYDRVQAALSVLRTELTEDLGSRRDIETLQRASRPTPDRP